MTYKEYTEHTKHADSYDVVLTDAEKQTPHIYKRVFEEDVYGKKILDDLKRRFYEMPSFDYDNQYMTSYNEGARGVIIYIINQLNTAKYNEENK